MTKLKDKRLLVALAVLGGTIGVLVSMAFGIDTR